MSTYIEFDNTLDTETRVGFIEDDIDTVCAYVTQLAEAYTLIADVCQSSGSINRVHVIEINEPTDLAHAIKRGAKKIKHLQQYRREIERTHGLPITVEEELDEIVESICNDS